MNTVERWATAQNDWERIPGATCTSLGSNLFEVVLTAQLPVRQHDYDGKPLRIDGIEAKQVVVTNIRSPNGITHVVTLKVLL